MSERFDKKYFDDIWGTVHRHDYTESLANRLIQQYGKVRILDCGTGCGHLVKLLREKGSDAWGFDVSDYALENSCASGYVVKAHASKLPFPDKYFDVVCSNGLFGYDENVEEIWAELNRVGKKQHHNVDYNDDIPEHQLTVIKPKEWWDSKLQTPKVLVSCPTYEGKEYCFQEWIDMAKGLTYPHDILVVDNSKTTDFYDRWKDKVPMIHLDFEGQKDHPMYRVCKSMAEIRKHFLKGNYTHWMNIEADNIPPKDVIETMMKYNADWVEHAYYANGKDGTLEQGIGCGLLSRRLIEDFNMDDDSIFDDSPDAELWNWVQKQKKYKCVELYFEMDVKHLK